MYQMHMIHLVHICTLSLNPLSKDQRLRCEGFFCKYTATRG
ncbi:hypothetical protein Zm00014a_011463 [Zea mays]|uniref:Uncharacterized protein n=1 Tax=Zea mays TaxID=4577 RepID=A0A317YHY7_MAIZE|nr:hypothetical protein Zm00014a_011463 [Zea mays]